MVKVALLQSLDFYAVTRLLSNRAHFVRETSTNLIITKTSEILKKPMRNLRKKQIQIFLNFQIFSKKVSGKLI